MLRCQYTQIIGLRIVCTFCNREPFGNKCTIKPVLSDCLKVDKTMVLMENGRLVKVERIAESSPWSIL